MVFIISRFNNNTVDNKNRDNIYVSDTVTVSSCSYKRIGSVHHHGSTISSGHYTSNIWFSDTAFLCNDAQILPLKDITFSDSIYMIFYARNESCVS